ncbi:MAG: DUF4956 domain-containing protein [Christensenellales bacterium]
MPTTTPTPNQTLSFSDILKDNLQLNQSLTLLRVLVTVGLAFLIGLFIFFIYKKTFGGVLYSRNFNVSLIMITMVTALIIMPVTSNITLSLGMVGALSIVRFRTAVKDPVDTIFMFWSIAAGITLGATFYLVTIVGSVLIGVLLLVVSLLKLKISAPYLLVLHFNVSAMQNVRNMLKQMPPGKLKSKTISQNTMELTIEMRMKDNEVVLVDKFLSIDGVYNASLISYQGNLVS